MAKKIIIAIFLLSLLVIWGCGDTSVVRVDDSRATADGVKAVVDANNQFAFDYYNQAKSSGRYDGKNLFFSPYSISSSAAMVYEGARGTTAEEMKSVFYFPSDDLSRRSAFARLNNNINKGDKDYILNTANAIWVQNDYPVLQDYLLINKNYFSANVQNMDFKTESEKARQTINQWVSDRTNDRINDILPMGSITPSTRLVLANAIYFKGNWKEQFEKKYTRDEDFKVSKDLTIKAPMMNLDPNKVYFRYAETEDIQALEIPYKGDEISMLILLPKENDLSIAEKYLDNSKFTDITNNLQKEQMPIKIPKFKFTTDFSLSEDLKIMGMPTAFTPDADLSGMTGNRDLMITTAIHKAFVEVNEEGTEAAAATVWSVGESMAMPKDTFYADHPFIFMIRENSTGNILFIGRVVDPTK